MVPRDLLQCWRDYWNGDYNEKANFNAIDFVMGQLDDVIAAAGAQEVKPKGEQK